MNLDVFLSCLEPLADKFSDPSCNEIRINPNGTVWEERLGQILLMVGVTLKPQQIEYAAGALAGETNTPFNTKHPRLDARLEDGSRVAILGPPVLEGIGMTIRRFPTPFTLEQLVAIRTVSEAQAGMMQAAIDERLTIAVSGSTRAGKTTLARVLLNLIPVPGDRLVLIEQPPELNLRDRATRDIYEMNAAIEQNM